MRPFISIATTFAVTFAVGLTACAIDDSPSVGVSQHVDDEIQCTATFHWLQKDAYAERAGRTSSLWPAHTTTQIDVKCQEGFDTSAYRENHGTKPGERDKDGNVFLVDVKQSEPVTAPWSRIQALLAAYKDCECAPSTEFLNVDLAKAEGQQLLSELGDYVASNMSCDGVSLTKIQDSFVAGHIDEALAQIGKCTWDDGASWSDGFEAAAKAALGEKYNRYHVCNDDAQLESALWDRFASGGEITACDGNDEVCHGPTFFYSP